MFRPLFMNEGGLGTAVVGHPRVEDALRRDLSGRADVDPVFVHLPPMGRIARNLARSLPVLGAVDLDLQPVRWHAVQSMRVRASVRTIIGSTPIDALHVNSHSVGLALTGVMRSVPTFLSVDATIAAWHGMGLWRSVRPWSRLTLAPDLAAERRAFRHAAGVVCWTDWSARDVRAASGRTDVEIVHPGIDLDAFRPGVRSPRQRPRVLFVGGRFAEKGGDVLLDALDPLLVAGEVELDVVTKADLQPREGLRLHRLDAGDDVLVELFRQADLFCLPTRADAVPFVVVEAMASGTAVVATPIAAIPELLGRDAGAIVPVDDQSALRAVIVDLLEDSGRRSAMGEAGRARCEAHYDSRRQTEILLDLMRRPT